MFTQMVFTLALAYARFSQRFYPTNVIARWMRQPGHLRYAWPLSIALYVGYYAVARWISDLPGADTNIWLQLALFVACIDALKFACGVVAWPLLGVCRGLRRGAWAVRRRLAR
ncbi:hypothetical protein [Isoptericola sp. NPDC019482]|uniref:hypothetical protein n=1 Tax=Isoptericola sp. NPDC019482 TaxID=3154688 RepID=UPI00346A22F0